MFRKNLIIALALLASVGYADTAIIEDFENDNDPANWQAIPAVIQGEPEHGQTHNATITGDVPKFIADPPPPANNSGEFTATWTTVSPAAALTNPYNSNDGTTFWAVHYNINAPSSLPNNSIPTATGILEASIKNNSPYPVQVALAVDSLASAQLERGPLVTVAGNSQTTYSWDFATTSPVGFVSGDGVFSGAAQRVKSLLVYTTVAPTVADLSLVVDNIRQVSSTDMTAPAPPRPTAFQPITGAGSAVLRWNPSPDADVASYRVYLSNDGNFGIPVTNRLSFPNAPATTVNATEHFAMLDELPIGENIYATVTAADGAVPPNESLMSQVMGINLEADGSSTLDHIVLDNDAFSPGQPDFINKGYFHSVVYTAQALDALGRSFDSVTAEAFTGNENSPMPNPAGVVVWSNLQDGETPGTSINAAGRSSISDFIADGGNVIVSGSALAQDISSTPGVLESVFKAQLQSGNIGVGAVDPSGPVLAVDPFSTTLNPITNAVAYATTANDGILPVNGSVRLAVYTGVAPGIAVSGVGYDASLVFLGFAFETAGNAAGPASSKLVRQNLMGAMIEYLVGETAANDWQLFE